MSATLPPAASPWPHRLAIALAGVSFPRIWVGGLVTTYDAGMAVPDWPGTYGYNLFLYPWQTWLSGPWDLFIEHGHRLLGALSGMLTIAVVVAAYRGDRRRWLRTLALIALAAVIGQGCLGGARVLLDARLLALLHGCLGPAFFGLCVALCVVSSRWWRDANGESPPSRFLLPAVTNAAAVYLQLVLGAVLRHIPVAASPGFFRLTVFAHLIVAGLVTGHLLWLTGQVARGRVRAPGLSRPVIGLDFCMVLQLVLGCATWIVNYWWPTWTLGLGMSDLFPLVETKGWLQSTITTAHAATGSLILGLSVFLVLRAQRVRYAAAYREGSGAGPARGAVA
jgi:cytochrome c oxidase assembly protein subunit 15